MQKFPQQSGNLSGEIVSASKCTGTFADSKEICQNMPPPFLLANLETVRNLLIGGKGFT